MSDLMFPGLADRAARNSQLRGAGASNSSPAAGPRTTGRVRTPLPDKGKPRSASGPASRSGQDLVWAACALPSRANKVPATSRSAVKRARPLGGATNAPPGTPARRSPPPPVPLPSVFWRLSPKATKLYVVAITKWRPVVKGMLEIWEEEKEGGGVAVAAMSAEEKKEEAKRAALRLVKVLF
ncbi:hypothetical protein MCOR16_011434 [Pyricularia oryzae]|nr:hypothetical protein MCOR16_011434 [Pyricularia oryzae]